ncbi:MAG: YesL family protein [Lachnospiraceae bacterium]|nr:YesL family protein [Candidatus Colinaster scatohippi]
MFKGENPVISFLGKITDLVILNLLCVFCSIPVFTIGAVWTAMYYTTNKMAKNEESYVWADFFKSFKQNFRQATVIWMANMIFMLTIASIFKILAGGSYANMSRGMFILAINIVIVVFAIMAYIYPVLSHFDDTIGITIKNAILLAIINLPYTVMMLVALILPVGLLVFAVLSWMGINIIPIGWYVIPVYILIGISGPAYICGFIWKRIFAKLDNKEYQGEKNGQEKEEQSK